MIVSFQQLKDWDILSNPSFLAPRWSDLAPILRHVGDFGDLTETWRPEARQIFPDTIITENG